MAQQENPELVDEAKELAAVAEELTQKVGTVYAVTGTKLGELRGLRITNTEESQEEFGRHFEGKKEK